MKTFLKEYSNVVAAVALIFSLTATSAPGQQRDTTHAEAIAVAARQSTDSITLRWAPLTFNAWHKANSVGYRVERFTIARNGNLLSQPERTIVKENLKPLPEQEWELLVYKNSYAAIAAQALYGDRFEIDLRQSDVTSIVNKVHENEQRFAFALFSADMSPEVAKASGLWFSDKSVRAGEKYLYRIMMVGADTVRGSIFIGPAEPYELLSPKNLKAEFRDLLVSLKWDQAASTPYTAYKIERSEDGIHYREISATPLVTVSPKEETDTRYEYATDSLPKSAQIFYYRVRGITAFGEEGPPSLVVSGKSIPSVTNVPYISSAENIDNVFIRLKWNFEERNNLAIEGFSVERATKPDGNFESLTPDLLSPRLRTFDDLTPGQVNYYRVRARGLDQAWYASPIYFAQLVDSIPPATPLGLEATIDDDGLVLLSWDQNTAKDIYGYRVYKSNNRTEEPAQITIAPVTTHSFKDSVNLQTLNENIYYSVMAVDINQNHSALSPALEVPLPDKVKPLAPIFLPVRSQPKGVFVLWRPGGSEDIVKYKIYRRTPQKDWEQLSTIEATSDSIISYFDETSQPGQTSHYTVVSVDDAGLESEPAIPVSGLITEHFLQPAIVWKKPNANLEENQFILSWKYDVERVASFRMIRSTDTEPPVLLQTLPPSERQFTDTIIPGKTYKYRIMALFENGQKSCLSEELEFKY